MIVFSLLLVAFGVCLILYPDIWWYRFEHKKTDAHGAPSRLYRFGARLTGGMLIAAAALLIVTQMMRG